MKAGRGNSTSKAREQDEVSVSDPSLVLSVLAWGAIIVSAIFTVFAGMLEAWKMVELYLLISHHVAFFVGGIILLAATSPHHVWRQYLGGLLLIILSGVNLTVTIFFLLF